MNVQELVSYCSLTCKNCPIFIEQQGGANYAKANYRKTINKFSLQRRQDAKSFYNKL